MANIHKHQIIAYKHIAAEFYYPKERKLDDLITQSVVNDC